MSRLWRIGVLLCALLQPLSGCGLHETLFGFPAPTITTTGAAPIEIGFRTTASGLMLIKGAVTRPGGAHADLEFILDTGAPVTVLVDGPGTTALGLDTRKATRLGPADNPAVPFGVIEPGFGVDFGPLRYSGLTAVVIAQSGFPCQERFARVGFQGIIGADIFKAFVVEVDTPNQRLVLHRPQAFMPGDMESIPLTFINGQPHIDTQIVTATGSYDVRLHVDTGSTTAASFKPGVRPGVVAAPGGKKGASCFVEGALETATGLPLTVALARRQARVDEPVLAAKERVDDASAGGSIGAPLLARYRYAIDYPGKRLWIGAETDRQ